MTPDELATAIRGTLTEAGMPAHRTRLWLNGMARQVLGNGLLPLGMAAPERI